MQRAFFFSLISHAAITIIAYFGFPYLNPEPSIADIPIVVDLVNVADESNPPPPKPSPEPEDKKLKELPAQPAELAAKPESRIMSELKPEVMELPLEPKPKPISKPDLVPKLDPKPKQKSKLAGTHPPRKPRPPDAFASVLKTLEAMEKAKAKNIAKRQKLGKDETGFEEAIVDALKSNSTQVYNQNLPVSMSETDAIKKHFQRCWNVPAGAKGAHGMVVELVIRFLQDGSVRSVRVLNTARMRMDSFFRITAEAAQRAVLHPKCNRLSMPPDKFPHWQSKYQKWEKMTLVFDPKDMF